MRLKFALFTIILCITDFAFAQTKAKESEIETELSQCLEKKENQTTTGMSACIYDALEKWNEKLNNVYKSLLVKLDTAAKSKLVEAQRQWIKFKEKEIDLIDATYGSAKGTMWRIVRANKVMEITKNRVLELEELLAQSPMFE